MVKNIFRRVWIGLIAVALICSALPLSKSLAMTEIKDDTDLSAVKAYQFSLKQENMEILSQSGSVVKDRIPANGEWKDSTDKGREADAARLLRLLDAGKGQELQRL